MLASAGKDASSQRQVDELLEMLQEEHQGRDVAESDLQHRLAALRLTPGHDGDGAGVTGGDAPKTMQSRMAALRAPTQQAHAPTLDSHLSHDLPATGSPSAQHRHDSAAHGHRHDSDKHHGRVSGAARKAWRVLSHGRANRDSKAHDDDEEDKPALANEQQQHAAIRGANPELTAPHQGLTLKHCLSACRVL